MSTPLVPAKTDRDPFGWRAGAVRVVANALLVLLALMVVTLGAGVAQMLLTGRTPSVPPLDLVLFAIAYLAIRWIVVLPGLLLVLVGLELVARRIPYGRAVFLLVACAPLAWWQLTQSGDRPGLSLILGATAVLFALVARLPPRIATPRGDARPASETTVVPR